MSGRPIVIGAGVNGLVAAFHLAKAGLRPLVLERADRVGGAALTTELAPGVRVPTLSHAVGPIAASVVADMQLDTAGVRFVSPPIASLTLEGDGGALVLPRDVRDAASILARRSPRDAERYPRFLASIGTIAAVAADLAAEVPPSLDSPTMSEMWRLLQTGRRVRAMGRSEAMQALRWGPMAVADLLEDCFETETLRATLATRGVFGTALGPRSAGTAAVLLLEAARQPESPLTPVFVQGGPGALTAAMAVAVQAAGGEIRCGAEVSRIESTDEGVVAVTLASGESIPTSLVVSNADPQRTLLGLVDPVQLEPDLRLRLVNYRTRGTVAKVNLVVDGLPGFVTGRALPSGVSSEQALSGRIFTASTIDALEQAFDASKYGQWSERPWLEVVIPTLSDPSLATGGRHVLSIYAQYAPYQLRDTTWAVARDAFTRSVVAVLAEHAPDLPDRIVATETLTPADLESAHALTGGHVHHGEMALDQLFVMRPTLGWGQYRTPVAGLYLCGAGTHPGGGITGLNGANAARAVIADARRAVR